MEETLNPYQGYCYRVLIDQKEEAGFSQVSSPSVSDPVIEYRGDAVNNTVITIPGIIRYSDVTLKFGVTRSHTFLDWIKTSSTRECCHKTVLIAMMDVDAKEMACWQLENTWPTRYTAPDFSNNCDETAIETLELVCEKITRIR